MLACVLLFAAAGVAMSKTTKVDATPEALAHAMQGHRIVLLGEVHDNGAQHALRVAALRRLLAAGARPAIAFEQFDRDHQADIDWARRERPGDADYLVRQAGGDPAWQWDFYRPFVALALEFDLPIVAANLSRDDAMNVAKAGWRTVFDAKTVRELGLDALPPALLRTQQQAIAAGHCDMLPSAMLAPLARAQIARDIVMAKSMQPFTDRGVVLLAGNGHVRRDAGVARWLPAKARTTAVSIGLLERGEERAPSDFAAFDVYAVTGRASRQDPCNELRKPVR